MALSNVLDAPVLYLTYQYLVGGIKARRHCIQDHVPLTPGMRVLDIGCGPGYVAKWLAGSQYVGLDTDERYIHYANSRYGKEYGKFSCELMTEEFVARNEPFDFVIMTGVLHHLDDPTAADVLNLCKKALKPNGVVITMDGYYGPGLHPVAKFLLDRDRGKYIRTQNAYLELARRHFGQVKSYDHPSYFRVPYTTIVMECRN
jgi:SAM-dependent methyltransferase